MTFSEISKSLRKENGLSQVQLAEALNVSKACISMIEIGKNDPTANTLLKYADFFSMFNRLPSRQGGRPREYYHTHRKARPASAGRANTVEQLPKAAARSSTPRRRLYAKSCRRRGGRIFQFPRRKKLWKQN